MTIVILAAHSAASQPWGWWDDEDSIAKPSPPRDSLLGTEGRIRLDGRSVGMSHSRLGYDASLRSGAWQASVAGMADSGPAPVRQRVGWSGCGAGLEAGDLSPWFADPLLEGGTRKSGSGTPLHRIGSGSGVSGIDLQATDTELLPWQISSHSRIAASSSGTLRSSMLLEVGTIRAGSTVTESGPHLPYAGLRLGSDDASADASILSDGRRYGFLMSGEASSGASHQRLSIRQIDRGLDHDGLPRGWGGASQAQFESRWRAPTGSIGASGEVVSDSCDRRTIRILCDAAHERFGIEGRVRFRWMRSDDDRLRFTPGVARAGGTIRPWIEFPWTRDEGFAPSAGLRWKTSDLQADAAVSRSAQDVWRWKVSSMLGRQHSRSGTCLQIAFGGGDDIEKGEGTWITSW